MITPQNQTFSNITSGHIVTLFAIMDMDTGMFLPEVKKSYTHSQPCWPQTTPPRLFTTKEHAKQALGWWLKGAQVTRLTHDWETGVAEPDGIVTVSEPSIGREYTAEGRKQWNFKVVEVQLHV